MKTAATTTTLDTDTLPELSDLPELELEQASGGLTHPVIGKIVRDFIFPPILTVGIVLPKDGGFDITDITDFDDDNVGVTPASKK
jgi:hypothetical protein